MVNKLSTYHCTAWQAGKYNITMMCSGKAGMSKPKTLSLQTAKPLSLQAADLFVPSLVVWPSGEERLVLICTSNMQHIGHSFDLLWTWFPNRLYRGHGAGQWVKWAANFGAGWAGVGGWSTTHKVWPAEPDNASRNGPCGAERLTLLHLAWHLPSDSSPPQPSVSGQCYKRGEHYCLLMIFSLLFFVYNKGDSSRASKNKYRKKVPTPCFLLHMKQAKKGQIQEQMSRKVGPPTVLCSNLLISVL